MSEKPFRTSANESDQVLCFACGMPMHIDAKFCERCNAPTGIFMRNDPLQMAHTEGMMYARAAHHARPRLPVVIFMWVVFFPIVVIAAIIAIGCLLNFTQMGFFGALLFLGSLAITYYVSKLLIQLTGRYLRKDLPPEND